MRLILKKGKADKGCHVLEVWMLRAWLPKMWAWAGLPSGRSVLPSLLPGALLPGATETLPWRPRPAVQQLTRPRRARWTPAVA